MDVVIARRSLLDLTTLASGVASSKSTMPILASVLLTAKGDRLECRSTDLYMSVSSSASAEVKRGGSLAVPCAALAERAKAMPDGPIHLSVDGVQLAMKSGSRKYRVQGLPGDDYPQLPSPSEAGTVMTITGDTLGGLIGKIQHAVSTDETRAHLNAAMFERDGKTLTLVATDGHRLALADTEVAGHTAKTSFLIPLKALNKLRRICEDTGAGEVSVAMHASTVFFTAGGVTFSARQVDSAFPPFGQVIPRDNNKSFAINRDVFYEAIRAVSLASKNGAGGVKMALSGSKLTVTSESADSGDAIDVLDVSYTGDDWTSGVNGKYMVDVLSVLDCEEVAISVKDELDPMLITVDGSEDCKFVVMPMRI